LAADYVLLCTCVGNQWAINRPWTKGWMDGMNLLHKMWINSAFCAPWDGEMNISFHAE